MRELKKYPVCEYQYWRDEHVCPVEYWIMDGEHYDWMVLKGEEVPITTIFEESWQEAAQLYFEEIISDTEDIWQGVVFDEHGCPHFCTVETHTTVTFHTRDNEKPH